MSRSTAKSTFAAAIAGLVIAFAPVASPSAAEQDFSAWLDGVRAEARERGMKDETISSALSDIAPIPRVIELDRRQPEFTLTLDQYLSRVVNDRRVRKGRARLAKHRDLLRKVSAKFGVQPRFILALWGIETDFGRLKGGFSVVPALATLAFDGRRSAYFRKELFNALTIIDQGHITAKDMIGSWAGAMGQNQFMPSSFLRYAVDHDGDGRRNIWTSTEDVFASTANYLRRVGWRDDQTWGRRVRVPDGFDAALLGLKVKKGLAEWQALGVRRFDGGDLPGRNLTASLVRPGKDKGPVFAVYGNYRAILRWNRAHFFATAVGRLADRIAGG
ncbi:MAG: lytic murein transglycosylase [Rhodospirillales bacterium]|nr:lytic murein transglycosylase [Rhodospirillales bacterium]